MNPFQPREIGAYHMEHVLPHIANAPNGNNDMDDEKCCWICYVTEEEGPPHDWVSPCRCRGSGKWVHESCLLRWIEEQQRGNRERNVSCPQCRYKYNVIYPRNLTIEIATTLDKVVSRICPLLFGVGVALAIYFNMGYFGEKPSIEYNEKDSALTIFIIYLHHIFLPLIPMVILVTRLLNWQDLLLRIFLHYPPLARFLEDFEVHNVDVFGGPINQYSAKIFWFSLALTTLVTIMGKLALYTEDLIIIRCYIAGIIILLTKFIAMVLQIFAQLLTLIGDYLENRDNQFGPARPRSRA